MLKRGILMHKEGEKGDRNCHSECTKEGELEVTKIGTLMYKNGADHGDRNRHFRGARGGGRKRQSGDKN